MSFAEAAHAADVLLDRNLYVSVVWFAGSGDYHLRGGCDALYVQGPAKLGFGPLASAPLAAGPLPPSPIPSSPEGGHGDDRAASASGSRNQSDRSGTCSASASLRPLLQKRSKIYKSYPRRFYPNRPKRRRLIPPKPKNLGRIIPPIPTLPWSDSFLTPPIPPPPWAQSKAPKRKYLRAALHEDDDTALATVGAVASATADAGEADDTHGCGAGDRRGRGCAIRGSRPNRSGGRTGRRAELREDDDYQVSHSRALASVWLRQNEQDDHVAAHSFVEDEEV